MHGPIISAGKPTVDILADIVEPPICLKEELARDPISASSAVLWLDLQNSGASSNFAAFSSLLSQGIAQVSLEHRHPKTNVAEHSGVGIGTHGVGSCCEVEKCGADGKNKLWLPTTVYPFPLGQTQPSQQQFPLCGVSAHGDCYGGDGDGEQRVVVPPYSRFSAFVSPCLAEALGLSSTSALHSSESGTRGSKNLSPGVQLSVRELPESRIVPAGTIELSGPYPIATTDINGCSTRFDNGGKSHPSSAPPSVVAAISSVLPCALDREVLSCGSVVRVAGLFVLVVTGVWAEGERGQRLAEEGEGDGDRLLSTRRGWGEGIVARVYGATELLLSPPTQPKIGEVVADSSFSSPAYRSTDTTEWVLRVEQDFGGLGGIVSSVVSTVQSVLVGSRGNSGSDGGRTGLVSPASGLLLHGPTGTGKTLLAKSVAQHSGAPWFFLDCASVFKRERGKAEQYVQDFLAKAQACSPSIVILDQVESFSRRRPEAAGITELQVFSVLVETMDRFRRLMSASRVFFLATCPDSSALDPSLLQRGRLETVMRLGALDVAARASVLGIHTKRMSLQLTPQTLVTKENAATKGEFLSEFERTAASELKTLATPPMIPTMARTEFLRLIAARCHGYLGSDLERLCREAAMNHMKTVVAAVHTAATVSGSTFTHLDGGVVAEPRPTPCMEQQEHREEDIVKLVTNDGKVDGGDGVRLQDFWAALDVVRPASLIGHSVGMWGGDGSSEEGVSAPLVGCDTTMAELRAFILKPLANPWLLRSLGLKAATGALLHGPPGCGKTSVARALAVEGKGFANFLEVRCSDLVDKVVGRSERAVSDLFAAARAAAPCVLFLDQVEGIAARRGYHSSTEQTFDRILSTLLVEMDGVMSESGGHVVVLAATNEISRLDPALLRPGRLDRRIHLGPPDFAARTAIFLQRLIAMPLQFGGGASATTAVALATVGKESTPGIGGTNSVEHCGRPRDTHGRGVLKLPRSGLLDSNEAYAKWLAGETEGCSGAQVTGVCREAALAALREEIGARKVAPRHFELALGGQRQHSVLIGGK